MAVEGPRAPGTLSGRPARPTPPRCGGAWPARRSRIPARSPPGRTSSTRTRRRGAAPGSRSRSSTPSRSGSSCSCNRRSSRWPRCWTRPQAPGPGRGQAL